MTVQHRLLREEKSNRTLISAVGKIVVQRRSALRLGLRFGAGVAALGSCVAGPFPSAAQVSQSSAVAKSDKTVLDEIVVTAQRRSQALQNVPISAQVISGSDMARQNNNSLSAITRSAPSVFVEKGSSTDTMYVRGVGSGGNQAFDQSVGTFVDDVYHGRSRTSAATLMDLERVELLKGPQTTYFGNNAIAGALNVVTKKPGLQNEADLRLLYGTFGQYAAEGAGTYHFSDQFRIRAAGIATGQNGWLEDVGTSRHLPHERNLAGRVSFTYEPTDRFGMDLKIEGSRDRERGGLGLQVTSCPPAAGFTPGPLCGLMIAGGFPTGLKNNAETGDAAQKSDLNTLEAALATHLVLGDATLSMTTALYRYEYGLHLDIDGLPSTQLDVSAPERYHQFSQEIRISSTPDRPIEYIAGAYFQSSHLSVRDDFNYSLFSPLIAGTPALAALTPYLPIGPHTDFTQPERVYSAFGSLTWNASPALKITAALRRSWVDRDFTRNQYYGHADAAYGDLTPIPAELNPLAAALIGVQPGTLAGSRHDHAWMPAARIQYQFTRTLMSYASFTRGFKAGGFNAQDTTGDIRNVPFNPEYVNAYEFGLKSELFGRRVLFNVALFRSDYSDLQVNIYDRTPGGIAIARVQNAASSRSQGAEFETKWVVNRDLHLGANLTYLRSRFRSYPNAGANSEQSAQGDLSQDLSGAPTAFAPRWSGSLSANYDIRLNANKNLNFEIDPFWSSSYFISPENDDGLKQSGYVRLDARISFGSKSWSVDLIGKNLTNTVIRTFGTAYPTSTGSYLISKQEPRNIAVQLRWKF